MKFILLSAMLMAGASLCTAQHTAYLTKYDFVPGDKVIAYEDFSATEIGDFPLKWNTNATAEVVTLANKPGKWMRISKESVFHPEFINNLPENFTLEFDLGVNQEANSIPFTVNITNLKKPEDFTNYYHYVSWNGTHTLQMELRPTIPEHRRGQAMLVAGTDGNHTVNSSVEMASWDVASSNFVHVAIWRQNQRMRVYVNHEKVFDIPRAFDATAKYNAITFATQGPSGTPDYLLVGNIRLAIGAPDTRNKLLTQGKFTTRGIHFNTNTDSLQPQSFGVLRDISNVLKENPNTRFKIIGHTDADGDDKFNADLSRRRAAAVKEALVKEFGINANNLEVEGKGESMPVDKNTTIEGKANNRRVEFIKL